MRPNFSEFSYGYALTEALVDGRQHLVRPIFPTQRQERGGGYDLRLDRIGYVGYPLFLQFKLCDGMTRRTAREIAYSRLPLHCPYLRMPLMPLRKSPQHNLLVKLESTGEAVFYSAPRFFRDIEFADAYRHRSILSRSAFIRPSTIGLLTDPDYHYVAFDCNARHGWVLSEPKWISPILTGGEFRETVHMGLRDAGLWPNTVREAIFHVADAIISGDRRAAAFPVVGGTFHQLCALIRQVYPEFPNTGALLDDVDSNRLSEGAGPSELLSYALRRNLERIVDNSDALGRLVYLLGTVAQIFLDSTVVLITRMTIK